MTAATLITSLSLAASPTAYVGYVIYGVGFIVRRAIGSAWLSQTLHGPPRPKLVSQAERCPNADTSHNYHVRLQIYPEPAAIGPSVPYLQTPTFLTPSQILPGLLRLFWWFVHTVFYSMSAGPENHNGSLVRLPVLIVIIVAPVVLNGQRSAHLPPDERIAVRLLYRYLSHSTAQLPQTLGDIVPNW